MGNIIFPCDDDNEIKVKEIHISLNHETQFKKNEDKLKLFLNHLHRHCYKIHFKYFIQIMKQLLKKEEKQIITDKNNLLIKNPPESNQTNIDNLSLNSSILKKDIGEDSQIIDNNLKNNNINHNQNKSKDKNETPDGDIIIQQEEGSPPKKEEPKPVNKGVTKKIKKKKKSPQNESNLTPIPEYPTVNTNFDKTLMPGDIILNFNDIPQMDKITEVENSIGGEFIIEQKELLKYMDEYPFSTKFFSIKYPSGEKYSGYYSPDWVKEVFGIQIDINGNKYDTKYFDELLERIKTIRVSERMAYQKITDLFIATATDYNPKSEEAYAFFKIVQNKLHYAISGHTAAELIFKRANSKKEHMGLTTWKNSPDGLIYKYDVIIAKNYLNEEEMNNLKDLTNLFLVFAEDEAKQRHVMTMKDWIDATDDLLKFRRKEILDNSGSISHKEAVEKAEKEYEKFRVIQEQKYISSMDEFYNKYLSENKEKK